MKKMMKKKNMISIERGLKQTLMLQNHSNISSGGFVRERKLKTETAALNAAAQDHATLITLKRLFKRREIVSVLRRSTKIRAILCRAGEFVQHIDNRLVTISLGGSSY